MCSVSTLADPASIASAESFDLTHQLVI